MGVEASSMGVRACSPRILSVVACLAMVLAAVSFAGGQHDLPVDQAKNREASKAAAPDKKYPNPELARLDRLVGHWEVVEKQYSPTGAVLSETKGVEDNTWILDHHALRRTYFTKGEAFYEAIGYITWNEAEKKYRGAWFDNVSTSGPILASGEWNDEGSSLIWLLEVTLPDGSKAQYKVIESFVDEETRTGFTYLVRGNDLVKRMEVRYKRALPCPTAGFRMIDDTAPARLPAQTPQGNQKSGSPEKR